MIELSVPVRQLKTATPLPVFYLLLYLFNYFKSHRLYAGNFCLNDTCDSRFSNNQTIELIIMVPILVQLGADFSSLQSTNPLTDLMRIHWPQLIIKIYRIVKGFQSEKKSNWVQGPKTMTSSSSLRVTAFVEEYSKAAGPLHANYTYRDFYLRKNLVMAHWPRIFDWPTSPLICQLTQVIGQQFNSFVNEALLGNELHQLINKSNFPTHS